jgi:hypothetical protein
MGPYLQGAIMSGDQGEGTFGTAPEPEPEPDQTFGEAPPKSRGPALWVGLGIAVVVVLAAIVSLLGR